MPASAAASFNLLRILRVYLLTLYTWKKMGFRVKRNVILCMYVKLINACFSDTLQISIIVLFPLLGNFG